jgi:hypothetical protein
VAAVTRLARIRRIEGKRPSPSVTIERTGEDRSDRIVAYLVELLDAMQASKPG